MRKFETIFGDPNVMLGAWKRAESWYIGGEGVPEPQFTSWKLNKNAWLERLSVRLSKGTYVPRPMLLVPYPKAGVKIRHYTQATIGDQIAFMAFAVLLAPVLEAGMTNYSFGNRWFRGLFEDDSSEEGRWKFRKWSLDDDRPYQPYSRAHGLFRRVANWTASNMLKVRQSPVGESTSTIQETDIPAGMLPRTASSEYWKKSRRCEKVFWARFDLKLAFPSVRLDLLHKRMLFLLDEVFGESDSGSLMGVVSNIFLESDLELYGIEIRNFLTKKEKVRQLVDYLIRALASVEYQPYDKSDEFCFEGHGGHGMPPILPLGNGSAHPGLPTGLGISPLLLNAYLNPIDVNMTRWFVQRRVGAFYRFVDDIVLMANSPRALAESIEYFFHSIEESDGAVGGSNLCVNWEKIKPKQLALALKQPVREAGRSLAKDSEVLSAIRSEPITKSENPFVTDLVENLSDLGTDRSSDVLPENAIAKVSRLREIIFLRPDDSAVPRATQLIFAVNHLAKTWLPEIGAAKDNEIIGSIWNAVSEAVRGASDKPRIWRSVVRAAVRRSFPGALHIEEGKAASAWLESLLSHFGPKGNGRWLMEPDWIAREVKIDAVRWNAFSVFHRSSFWRALAEVSSDMWSAERRVKLGIEIAEPESWIFRCFDEVGIVKTAEWLEIEAAKAVKTLYGRSERNLSCWEIGPFAVAMMSFVPSLDVVEYFRTRSRKGRMPFFFAVSEILEKRNEKWKRATEMLRQSPEAGQPIATLPRLLALSKRMANDEKHIGTALSSRFSSLPTLLRFSDFFNTQSELFKMREAIKQDLDMHESRLKERRKRDAWAIARELEKYERSRRIWIGLK